MKLIVENYVLFLKIGHFDAEKIFSREVYVSLDIDFLFNSKTFDNNLVNTLDYSQLLTFLDKKYTSKSFDLIETLIVDIAKNLCLHFELIDSLTVKVEKSFLSKKISKNARLSLQQFFRKEDLL